MTPPERHMFLLARVAGALAVVVGALVLLGWTLDVAALKSLVPHGATMTANSALCVALAGAALLGVRSGARARAFTVPLALAVAVVGAATTVEHAFGVDVGIDQLLFADASRAHPGRMSVISSLSLALLGAALALAARPTRRAAIAADTLASIAGALALASVVGHGFGAAAQLHALEATGIAVHTAFTLLLLSAGVLVARRDAAIGRLLALDGAAGKLARRLAPACVLIPLALGWAWITAWEASLLPSELGIALLATASVTLFLMLALVGAAQVDREEQARRRADDALREANLALEQRVRERTAALAASQRQLRAMIDGAPDAIVTVREDGTIDASNPAAARLFGRAASETRGAPFASLVAEREAAALDALLARARRGDAVAPVVLAARLAGGAEHPVEITLAAWHDDGAAPIVATARDVSARESVARALRRSESHLRRILETTHDAIWVHRERRIVYANGSLARALGYASAEALVGQGAFDHLHPDERAGISERIVSADAGAVDEGRVTRFRTTRGEELALELVGRPIEWDGAPAILLVGRDVTQRQRAEAELRRTSALLRAILESTQYMMVSSTPDGVIQEVSRSVERTLGWTRDELVGRASPALFHDPEELAARGGHRPDAVDEGEWTFVRKDGSRLAVSLSRTVLRDAGGQVTGALAVASDITEARRARQELIEAKEAAEAAMRSRSEFLARMSHEIRTPLNGVIGMTDLALATELDRLQRDYLETVRVSADHLLRLINDILDFSRIDAGKLRLESTPFRISDALGGVLRGLAARAYEKGLELILDVAPDVPARVVGDPHRLAQIVVNLAGNAIKFTDRGEIVVSVAVAARREGGVVLDVRVRDTGIGIEADKLEVIFDAFQQADNTMARRFGGTGLGLAIARDLARMMGGEMTVSSAPGRGSEFAFTVALGVADAATVGDVPPKPRLAGLPVLIVEDSATVRELLARMLRSWGLVPTAVSPAEAKGLTGLAPYRLVLIDADDFVTDALAVMRRLRADDPGAPPVVILSAGSRITTSGERSWIAGHVPKPVTPSNLLETVEAVIIGARRRTGLPSTSLQARPVIARRVLIADDNAVNRKVARGILERAGHEVVAVEHGRAALETLARERFDVALLDVEMPVLDGLETTRAIRDAEEARGAARLPIVALTAQAMTGDRERCLAAGADAYLAKPFEPRELLSLVEALAPAPTGVATRRASIAVAPVGPAIWNRAELLDRVSGDRALLLELVELFLEQGPRLRGELDDAARAGDGAAVARVAHQLKGMLATLGAHPASATARDLEEALRDGAAADLVERAGIVSAAVLRVEEAAAAERERPG